MKSCHRTLLINLNVKYTNIYRFITLILHSETKQYEKLFDMGYLVQSVSKKNVDKSKYNTDDTSDARKMVSGKCTNTFF